MTADTSSIRRTLSGTEMAAILNTIDTATSTAGLTTAVLAAVLNILLGDDGRSLDRLAPGEQINPGAWEIPASQWQAITSAAAGRAMQWGTGAMVSLELVNRMPGSFEDPTACVPDTPAKDWRPTMLGLHLTRDAVDVIAAAGAHITKLGVHFGRDSQEHLDAAQSWLKATSTLLSMNLGATTTVRADGDLSLAVQTASGLYYGIIFHGVHRTCAAGDGCAARIADDGNISTAWSGAFVADHSHQPGYPLNAPRPGQWSLHS